MNIQKYLRGLTAVALFAGMMPAAQAQTATGNFDVTVTLISACQLPVTIGDLAFGTYTAFQTTALVATPVTATFSCTRGLTGITANFDTAVDATAAAAATNAVGAGVIAGLQYDILATPQAPGVGTAATPSNIGTATTYPFQITGTMPLGQAGTKSTGVQTQTRTLTINF